MDVYVNTSNSRKGQTSRQLKCGHFDKIFSYDQFDGFSTEKGVTGVMEVISRTLLPNNSGQFTKVAGAFI